MIIPVRCFSCGKVIAHLWEQYLNEQNDEKTVGKLLTKLGLTKYCCRSIFLTHVDTIDNLLMYN